MWSLENDTCRVSVNPLGGAFTAFVLKRGGLNPLDWRLPAEAMPKNNRSGAAFQSHFLCLGRWGAPSEAEIAAGVPHNGEACRDDWELVTESDLALEMRVHCPLEKYTVLRRIELSPDRSRIDVAETVSSHAAHDRLWNVVQHVTLGGAFLTADLRIESNAGVGFMQDACWPDPNQMAFVWPAAMLSSGAPVDLRRSDTASSYVSTHLIPPSEETGWVSATCPHSGLRIIYGWPREEYPWLNVWHQVDDTGFPAAKGIEFGTTGLGRPYADLVRPNALFNGTPSYVWLPAKTTQTRRWHAELFSL